MCWWAVAWIPGDLLRPCLVSGRSCIWVLPVDPSCLRGWRRAGWWWPRVEVPSQSRFSSRWVCPRPRAEIEKQETMSKDKKKKSNKPKERMWNQSGLLFPHFHFRKDLEVMKTRWVDVHSCIHKFTTKENKRDLVTQHLKLRCTYSFLHRKLPSLSPRTICTPSLPLSKRVWSLLTLISSCQSKRLFQELSFILSHFFCVYSFYRAHNIHFF